MLSKILFKGGDISLREPGEMFDQKTGKKRTWTKAVKVNQGKGSVTLGKDFLQTLSSLAEDPEFQEWIKDIPE